MKIHQTIHEAYIETLKDIYFNYDYRSAPRGLPVREKTDYTFRVLEPVNEPIRTYDFERNKVIEDYTRKEVELYDSCTNLASDFGKASKFWEKLANPDGTVNSAYGYLIWKNKSHGNAYYEAIAAGEAERLEMGVIDNQQFRRTPWEWAKQCLIADKDTRQAILRFSLPNHQWIGNKDQTCTMHANFLIREDKLNLSVVMRSNDLVLGLVYDMPWFVSLIDRMVEELKPHYPNISKGTYTHTVHSLHIYEKNEEMVLRMIGAKGVEGQSKTV
jgi:thymidylate synthase